MSIEATRARRAREKQQLHVDDPRMAFLGTAGGGVALGDATGVINSETPFVGTATNAMRKDAWPGLEIAGQVGDPGEINADLHQTLTFYYSPLVTNRKGLGVLFGNHGTGKRSLEDCATGLRARIGTHGTSKPSLEAIATAGNEIEGLRVKLAISYSTHRSVLNVDTAGIGLPLSEAGAIIDTGTGPEVNYGDGLKIDANVLKFNMGNGLQKSGGPGGEIEVKPKAGGSIAVTADGVDTTSPAHPAATAGTGISVGGTSGQEIGNTDTGSAARTAHESAWNHSSFESLKHSRGHVLTNPSDHTDVDSGFSLANGAMMYYYNYAWRSLAAGNEGDVLTMASGIPAWQAP